MKITAGGQTVPWKRDAVNMYAFHVTVPAGASSLDVAFDFITPPEAAGFSSGASATTELAVLNWNQVLLYPEGVPSDQLRYQANLHVPDGWKYGTALPIAREVGKRDRISAFVADHAGRFAGFGRRPLPDHRAGHATGRLLTICIWRAIATASIEITPEQIEHYKNLVEETGALFGSRHYRSYHFLLTLSDHVASFGLEHHESSDDRVRRARTDRRVDAQGRMPICCRTSSRIPGTANTGVPRVWRRPIIASR